MRSKPPYFSEDTHRNRSEAANPDASMAKFWAKNGLSACHRTTWAREMFQGGVDFDSGAVAERQPTTEVKRRVKTVQRFMSFVPGTM
jgi:hypothetical protein